jgi:hypothetical protein
MGSLQANAMPQFYHDIKTLIFKQLIAPLYHHIEHRIIQDCSIKNI